jgi:DM4/DM12 family
VSFKAFATLVNGKFKAIFSPSGNFTQLYPSLTKWQRFPLPGKRRRREILRDNYTGQKYEKYTAEVNEIGNEELKETHDGEYFYDDDLFDDEFPGDGKIALKENLPAATEEELADTSGTRWLMYDGLGRLLNSKGLQGRPCVLRAICEAAETKLNHESGLLGELLHIVFR